MLFIPDKCQIKIDQRTNNIGFIVPYISNNKLKTTKSYNNFGNNTTCIDVNNEPKKWI